MMQLVPITADRAPALVAAVEFFDWLQVRG
jgi:hypothetical protein